MASVHVLTKRPRVELDPFWLLWRLFTSVRFALALVGFIATLCMIGILVPQVPTPMLGNEAAMASWYETQADRYGAFTEPMRQLGTFDIFRSMWFISALGVLVMSVSICTANRIPPIWRNVTRPQVRVSDHYFERDQAAILIDAPDVTGLVRELERRRYRVIVMPEQGRTFLFADRFPWSQFATFVSHLALILFLAGGFVTIITARDLDILIAEGETRPVFNPGDPDHMQIFVDDAIGRFDDNGFPLDYRTKLRIYQSGQLVKEGTTTVNDPITYDGFKFHQTAYFPDGAALEVRDARTGRLVFDEVLALTSRIPAPRIEVRSSSGSLLLNEVIFPTDFIANTSGSLVSIPGAATILWIGVQSSAETGEWRLLAFRQASSARDGIVVGLGETAEFSGLELTFAELSDVASLSTERIPGTSMETTVEMIPTPDGNALVVTPVAGFTLVLGQDQPQAIGDYQYTFRGQREFAGVTVRRDPGATVIWIATGVFLVGLMMTFYLPRRRVWARIAGGQASVRALGGSSVSIVRETHRIAENARQNPPDSKGRAIRG